MPYGAAVPFLPIRDAVRTAAGITDEDDRGSVLRKLEHALVAVGVDVGSALPSLFDLLGISIESGQRVEIDPATVKRRIFETVRLMLVSYSKQRPLVLVVEDLHWLDRTSEEFFTEFVDDVAARPMLLVSTYRPGYGAPLIGKSFVTQLALRALIDADSMHLVRNLLTEPVAGDEVARTIVSRAEGNPLFLEELGTRRAANGARKPLPSTCHGRFRRSSRHGSTVLTPRRKGRSRPQRCSAGTSRSVCSKRPGKVTERPCCGSSSSSDWSFSTSRARAPSARTVSGTV